MELFKKSISSRILATFIILLCNVHLIIPEKLQKSSLLETDYSKISTILANYSEIKNIIGVDFSLEYLPNTLPLNEKEIARVSSKFGESRKFPFRYTHKGVDLAGKRNTPIKCTAEGIVTFAGHMRGYGKIVEVTHKNGISTRYAHLNAINVAKGDTVLKFTELGKLGSTGRSTGSHLHYEIRINNIPVDPLRFVSLLNTIT